MKLINHPDHESKFESNANPRHLVPIEIPSNGMSAEVSTFVSARVTRFKSLKLKETEIIHKTLATSKRRNQNNMWKIKVQNPRKHLLPNGKLKLKRTRR
jgi:hypothetical protein